VVNKQRHMYIQKRNTFLYSHILLLSSHFENFTCGSYVYSTDSMINFQNEMMKEGLKYST
jgi:hypothetical protein